MAKNFTSIHDLIKKHRTGPSVSSVSHSKEVEPGADFGQIKEVVEHEPEAEVEKFVTPRAETIKLPPELKKLGLQEVAATKFPSYKNIKLPLSDEKVIVGRRAPITSSLRWLAELATYLLSQAHLALKVVHGKVVRVLKA